ncbi:hypothetical protein BpHYR1_010232 [Brachionus plicatilis]|uniref:Uncharacterized protein n=1 Tax=Brachionus plicatilis TaxID=10195 RepID=A0A3M7Q3A8_BRAPC|nr:hypothetical protein BpHYR1_010232 [Brachionus plicatilis]
MVEMIFQKGGNDCDLFALTYAYELSLKRDPANCTYDQDFMRYNFNMGDPRARPNGSRPSFEPALKRKIDINLDDRIKLEKNKKIR